jgi:cytochrome P450
MMGLTLDIVSRTLFSTALTDDQVQAVRKNMAPMLRELTRRLQSIFDFWDRLPLPRNYRFRGYVAHLDQVIYRIIEERRQSGEEKADLLGMLMAARDEETNEQMNDRQLRDEAMTIFIAGHETTANLLSWLCYLLSLHPNIRGRLTAEVDELLQGRTPTLADVPHLTYTRMIK